jgi:two-component system sensor histidine kinase KdpD
VRHTSALAFVAAVVIVYKLLVVVNPTTVALTLLVGVLVTSAAWGLTYAVILAFVAAAAFNFFFLPPFHTFTISDPHNWVALITFLVTAVIASQLSERARRAAENANRRRAEVDGLYAFSQHVLLSQSLAELLNTVPARLGEIFPVRRVSMFLTERGERFDWGKEGPELDYQRLQSVAGRGEPQWDQAHHTAFTPLRIGATTLGSLGISGTSLSRYAIEALGSLVAIAIERNRALEQLSATQAAHEAERLRSTLLDSVAHNFRTPLTSIKASVTALLTQAQLDDAERRELLTVINEESDRLNRLVGKAIEMAKIDARRVELHRERRSIGDALDEALAEAKQIVGGHPLEVDVPADLPPVHMDVERIKTVLLQFLENAAKYSPPASPISIASKFSDGHLITQVTDCGPGMDLSEQALIFDQFFRGRAQRRLPGSGMGLTIAKAIVEAHGGQIGVNSEVGRGSTFWFKLPVD